MQYSGRQSWHWKPSSWLLMKTQYCSHPKDLPKQGKPLLTVGLPGH
jgi:hypothetical protein